MLSNGTIKICVFSTDRDDLKPPAKGDVRAELLIGGWILEPLEDDPNKTRCTFTIELNLKGSIPTSFVKKAI